MTATTPDIDEFRKRLQQQNRSGLVIDLDETLSATMNQWAPELVRTFGNPRALSDDQIIERMASGDIPFDDVPAVTQWMISSLQSPELTLRYPIVAGSDRGVAMVDKIIPVVGYLTVRETVIKEATAQWLQQHGFPDEPVITRPDELRTGGLEWKAGVLTSLYPYVLGSIDDSVELIRRLPGDYPGTIFLIGATDRPDTPIDVVACPTWDDVAEQVTRRGPLLLTGAAERRARS